MRQKIILVLVTLLSLVTVLSICKRSSKPNQVISEKQDTLTENTTKKPPVLIKGSELQNDTVRSNWLKYTNKNTGISFYYPDKWKQIGVQSNAVNLNGNTISVLVSFSDSITQSFFSIEYHPSPYGEELFKSYQTEFKNLKLKKQEIKIAETNALETFITKSHDIKGNIYDPPLRIIQIAFPGKSEKGEYTIHFETPEPNSEPEVNKFNQLISSIQISTPSTNY
jgi:hypothetical protein